MDELNKRIIELMVKLEYSKSAFAAELDVSLPLITHITSGRNKPGLELIQKLLSRFEQVSPDWLLLGKGSMYREQAAKPDITPLLQRLSRIERTLEQPEQANQTMHDYHKLLMDEVLHLKELSGMITESSDQLKQVREQVKQLRSELNSLDQ